MTGRPGIRRKQLLDDLEERRGYQSMKQEALDRTRWRTVFGRSCGPVVRNNDDLKRSRLSNFRLCVRFRTQRTVAEGFKVNFLLVGMNVTALSAVSLLLLQLKGPGRLGYGLGDRETLLRFTSEQKDFSVLQRVQTRSWSHPESYSVSTGDF